MSSSATSNASVKDALSQTQQASYAMATLSADVKNRALETLAQLLLDNTDFLLTENAKDVAVADSNNVESVLKERLKLDANKIAQLAQGIRDIAHFDEPVGKLLAKTELDDGLVLEKVSVPLGTIGIIFESRPDVLPQILSLILKTGNAVVFKGGKEAAVSNAAMMAIVDKLNAAMPELPTGWATLLETREAAMEMLDYPEYLDLVIPRGSAQLIQSVMTRSKAPVLGHADGICHLYVHDDADLDKALPVIIDAKTQYAAACNALETLLVNQAIAASFLPELKRACDAVGITLIGCEASRAILPELQAATEADWRLEYGDFRLSLKLVPSLEDAIAHINTYGSHHTDCILTRSPETGRVFQNAVDAANVYVNASTRFADGFRYGFGAEIGISTSKTHARGPVGIDGLLSYKYRLTGAHHVVSDYVGENAKVFTHKTLPLTLS